MKRLRRSVVLLLVGVSVVTACADPAPTPVPSSAVEATGDRSSSDPAPEPTPEPTPVSTLRVALDEPIVGGLSNAAAGSSSLRAAGFLYDGLYELDEQLAPVPVLASGPPSVSSDGLTWTVTLRPDVTFHDGSPMTADDVVATYRIAMSPRCRFDRSNCLASVLDDVTRLDDLTVAFTLDRPMASFAATHLGLFVESSARIEAAYTGFLAGVAAVTAADTTEYLDRIAAEESRPTGPDDAEGDPTVDYGRFRADGEALLTRAAMTGPDEAAHTRAGELDMAAYVGDIIERVRAIDAVFTSTPADALAAAYPYLATQAEPVGTGPFRFVSHVAGQRLEYAANDAYVLGRPRIEAMVFEVMPPEAAAVALAEGRIDWAPSVDRATYEALDDAADIAFVEYPEFGFLALYFNLHPDAGGLFMDPRLRQAVAHCFDRDAAVRAATGGHGMAIDSEIPVESWAHPGDDLARYPLDRQAATALIEAAGWTLGDDGVYTDGDRRLSTVIPVREGFPDRVAWLTSVADQVRECGIDLRFEEVSEAAIASMLNIYPHVNAAAPGSGRPFEAYFGGFLTGIDPDPSHLYHSSLCTTAEQPDTNNYICYQDLAVDALMDEGRSVVDQARRTAIYHDYARALADDLPVIYAWSDIVREGLRTSVGSTAPGGLQLDTPTWYRQAEKLTVRPAG